MSFVTDQIRRIDAHLDRHQPAPTHRPSSRGSIRSTSASATIAATRTRSLSIEQPSKRVELLEALIKALTTASSSRKILPAAQLQQILALTSSSTLAVTTSRTAADGNAGESKSDEEYGHELEWLLVSKLAAQVQGMLLQRLLDEITPVMDDIYYWEGVLGSYNWSSLYMVQLLPLQLWKQGKEAVNDARENIRTLRENGLMPAANGLAQEWRQFYGIVCETIRERQLMDVRSRLLSPVAAARMDARRRLQGLNQQKQMCAAAIGILSNESLNPKRISQARSHMTSTPDDSWKQHVASSVGLMNRTVESLSNTEDDARDYESTVLGRAKEIEEAGQSYDQICSGLFQLLSTTLPEHEDAYLNHRKTFGRPSKWVRYWLPATALLLSSTTLLRILVNRQEQLLTWIRDFGKTTIAFWQNWVVEPVRDIIGTIRHDKDSEIALMSRESLESDRASLERMVVDFALENPETAGASPLDEATVELIRNKVKSGDLTPVLRAYEHDLKRPFARAVTGNLVRELLIQIQKTKVDVEIAMSGIDSLLKSQELVFGLVGLTPGILVCILFGRWMTDFLGGRKGRSQGKMQNRLIRVMRNIDRILSNAEPQDHGLLTYKDHGLVLCEVQVLQANSGRVLPGEINKEFLEDLKDLTDIHLGVEKHIKAVDRLRWAYWKWLN